MMYVTADLLGSILMVSPFPTDFQIPNTIVHAIDRDDIDSTNGYVTQGGVYYVPTKYYSVNWEYERTILTLNNVPLNSLLTVYRAENNTIVQQDYCTYSTVAVSLNEKIAYKIFLVFPYGKPQSWYLHGSASNRSFHCGIQQHQTTTVELDVTT